jgi:P4 family phage/plasmid primase-like protien
MSENKQSILDNLMFNSTKKQYTDTDIARYVYEKYKHEFKCGSIAYNKWYHYNNHRWVSNERGYSLKKLIITEVVCDYIVYSKDCMNKSEEIEEGDEKDTWKSHSKTASELVSKLKTVSYRNNLFTECMELFYDEKFEDMLDSNNNLLHFNNGVYDLDKNEFREGYIEDNISMTTGINYIEEPTEEDQEKMTQIEEFLNKVLPIESVKNYVLTLLASFLHGMNKELKFHFWIGSGSNGKSTLIEFYKKTIGQYYGSMPITALTHGQGGSENASPVLAATRGKRIILLDEVDSDSKITVGFIKQLTGGDQIGARQLTGQPFRFRPQFKIVYISNELPRIHSNDDGTWRRIRVVEFISKFGDNPNPTKPYEFTIDRELPNKFEEWKEVFMYILIQYFQKVYKVNGIVEPDEILKHNHDCKCGQDYYTQFANEYLREDPTSKVGIDDIFSCFRSFLNKAGINSSKYARREFETQMNKILGKCNNAKKWKGWKLIDPNDDDEDDDDDDDDSEKKTTNKDTDNDTIAKNDDNKTKEDDKKNDIINSQLPPPPPPLSERLEIRARGMY